jgi:hypothetical protein
MGGSMLQFAKAGKLFAKLTAAIGLSALVACGAVADGDDGKELDARVAAFLGADLISILADADRIETFLLQPSLAPENGTGPDFVAGYRWKARGADLAPAQIAAFRALLFDAGSYDFDVVKKCPMVPEYIFRVHAGGRSADVQLSFGCTMWAVADSGDWKVEDFDAATEALRAVVETVFKLD